MGTGQRPYGGADTMPCSSPHAQVLRLTAHSHVRQRRRRPSLPACGPRVLPLAPCPSSHLPRRQGDEAHSLGYYAEAHRVWPVNLDVISWLGAYHVRTGAAWAGLPGAEGAPRPPRGEQTAPARITGALPPCSHCARDNAWCVLSRTGLRSTAALLRPNPPGPAPTWDNRGV